jgi:hypothetical protein
VNQRTHLTYVGIVVENHDFIGSEPNIQLHAVGAVSDGEFECLDAVVGSVRRGASVSEHEGPAAVVELYHG